jgi:transposase
MTTKIHAVTDGLGRCIDFTLTEGQIHDCTQAERLLEGKSPENVLADKGYDADAIRACIRKMGAIQPERVYSTSGSTGSTI